MILSHRSGMVGAILVIVATVLVLAAPVFSPYEEIVKVNLRGVLQPPSWEHPLGTDQLGRDLFGRLLWGGRISLGLSIFSVCIGLGFGTLVGTMAAYYDGPISALMMRLVDAMMAFPRMLVALFVITVIGQGTTSLAIAIGVSTIPIFARLTRGSALSVKNLTYIEAARSIGASDFRIIGRHILPNILSPIIVQGTLTLAATVILAAGLSFLGLGPAPPTPEWGAMTADARSYLERAPHLVLAPSLAVFIVVLGFNLLGDALRDILDPRDGAMLGGKLSGK